MNSRSVYFRGEGNLRAVDASSTPTASAFLTYTPSRAFGFGPRHASACIHYAANAERPNFGHMYSSEEIKRFILRANRPSSSLFANWNLAFLLALARIIHERITNGVLGGTRLPKTATVA